MKPELQTHYIDTGKVKLEWRHFPFIGAESFRAAVASVCADAQGKFWPYHDYLYSNQKPIGSGALSDANLVKYAAEVGLDTAAFSACMADTRNNLPVALDFQQGRAQGITGTPTFTVNGKTVIGAQPFATWVEILDAQLKPAGS